MNGDGERQEMVRALREMCGGSVDAFDRFYGRYAPLVMQVSLRMLGDRMEAEDMCHDVFLEVLRRGDSYDAARGSIEAWLAVLTRSRCVDRLRRGRKLIVDRMDADSRERRADAAPGAEESAMSRLQREAVLEALGELPGAQRSAVAAAYFAGRTQREMAERWNVPLGTVKSWVRYGLHNMKKKLEKHGWTEEREGGKGYGTD